MRLWILRKWYDFKYGAPAVVIKLNISGKAYTSIVWVIEEIKESKGYAAAIDCHKILDYDGDIYLNKSDMAIFDDEEYIFI